MTASGARGQTNNERSGDLLRPQRGTYIMMLDADNDRRITIGRRMTIDVRPGRYLYVGSAFGPGGVRARVNRHFRNAGICRWHVDYLRRFTRPAGALVCYGARDTEHRWARALDDAGLQAVTGFGCSDCRCRTHLYMTGDDQNIDRLLLILGNDAHFVPAPSAPSASAPHSSGKKNASY